MWLLWDSTFSTNFVEFEGRLMDDDCSITNRISKQFPIIIGKVSRIVSNLSLWRSVWLYRNDFGSVLGDMQKFAYMQGHTDTRALERESDNKGTCYWTAKYCGTLGNVSGVERIACNTTPHVEISVKWRVSDQLGEKVHAKQWQISEKDFM